MERKQRKNLIAELTGRLEFEKISGSKEKEVVVGGVYQEVRRRLGKPLKITKTQMDQLVALHNFVKIHNELTQEDLNELLNLHKHKFKFLVELNNMLPDFLDELKDHGPGSVACYYANRKQLNKELERRLP